MAVEILPALVGVDVDEDRRLHRDIPSRTLFRLIDERFSRKEIQVGDRAFSKDVRFSRLLPPTRT